jgi:alkanesulfonate monooxygenase SsuD/methylene tetrahydromethanopterin reductase-like flavin-dependent oxidoreductase (luciferase family)
VRANISTYDDIYNSLGELQMRQIGSVSGARKIHGGPEQVADGIEKLIKEFGCAGVAVTLPVWQPDEIRRFGQLVLPVLERRGLWSHPRTRNFGW